MSHRSSTLLPPFPPPCIWFFFPKDWFFFYFSQGSRKQGNSNWMILCCGYFYSQDQISLRKSVCSVPSFPHSLFFFPISTKALKTKICSSFCFFALPWQHVSLLLKNEAGRLEFFLRSVLLGTLKRSPQRNTYSNCANWVSHACYLSLILTKR